MTASPVYRQWQVWVVDWTYKNKTLEDEVRYGLILSPSWYWEKNQTLVVAKISKVFHPSVLPCLEVGPDDPEWKQTNLPLRSYIYLADVEKLTRKHMVEKLGDLGPVDAKEAERLIREATK
ncbi:MAG TPA: hypothetical protein VE981_10830 [Planctomycetota bacterium]|nr:hypothetical protein [Planctomycetota bacterium]